MTYRTLLFCQIMALLALLAIHAPTCAQTRTLDYFDPYSSNDLSRLTLSGGTGLTVFKNDLHGMLEGKSQNDFMNFYANIAVAYRWTDFLSLRVGISNYQLYGAPSAKANKPRFLQNPAIASSNFEWYAVVIHDFVRKNSIDHGKKRWNVYTITGLGFTLFEPTDAATGEDLRPQTEDEVGPYEYAYSNLMPIFPVGAGFSYYFADNQALSFEFCYRFSASDWLDHAWHNDGGIDIERFDGYGFVGLRYQYTFLKKKNNSSYYKR